MLTYFIKEISIIMIAAIIIVAFELHPRDSCCCSCTFAIVVLALIRSISGFSSCSRMTLIVFAVCLTLMSRAKAIIGPQIRQISTGNLSPDPEPPFPPRFNMFRVAPSNERPVLFLWETTSPVKCIVQRTCMRLNTSNKRSRCRSCALW